MAMLIQLKFNLDHSYNRIQVIKKINSRLVYSWTQEVAGHG